ncbi:MAG: hypothetical protein NTZ98_09805, partial [Acidobacteria bacterium]|nr:hypothetical protein [Acidobacteriota bacterium]
MIRTANCLGKVDRVAKTARKGADYRKSLNIATSLILRPRERANRRPSRDQSKLKIRSAGKSVSGRT